MAKKRTEENKAIAKKSVSAFMNMLKKETGAEAFNESRFTKVDHYIDTSNYGLNRIISGSVFKGMPSGCITLFSGDSATGKTLQAFIIAKNALEKNNYGVIIYVDSEGGANRGMMETVGIDMSKVQYVPVANIEECTIKLINIYKTIKTYQENNDPDFRALVILDSLGGLVSEKVLLDAENDKNVSDMGSTAKKCLFPDTQVLMKNNEYKCIKDIQIGDVVISGKNIERKVIDVFSTKHSSYYEITVGNDTIIKCSGNHKFLLSTDNTEDNFAQAEDLKVGNILSGNEIISIKKVDEEVELWDIEVEEDHTFCITESNIVVHNCSSMLRAVTMQSKLTDCAMLILSQQYDNPNQMYASKTKNIRGGKAAFYQPSLIVQMSRRLEKAEAEKDEDGKKIKDDAFFGTSILSYFTVKTRNDVRPFLECDAALDFKKGFSGNEYYGLIAPAIQLGFIKQNGGYYRVPSYSDKQLRLKELLGGPTAKKIWDTFIEEFDKKSSEQISYKTLFSDNSEETQQAMEEMKQKGFSLSEEDLSAEVEEEETEE